MTTQLLIFKLFYFLNFLVIIGVHGVNIQAYRYENFTELLWVGNSTRDCTNVPEDKLNEVHSIRTDTCFIVYNGEDCAVDRSTKYMPGDIIISEDDLERAGWIYSFHTCNEKEGGNQLDVDITWFLYLDSIYESYKNVCSCINVPSEYVQSEEGWSINNHHNDMFAYYESDCSEKKWKSKFVAAGYNPDSKEISTYAKTDSATNITYQIQSFGPDPNSPYFKTSCYVSQIKPHSGKLHQSTTETENDAHVDLSQQFKELTIQLEEIKRQNVDIKQNQDNFMNGVVKQFLEGFSEFNENIKELQHEFGNFTEKIKCI